MPLRDASEWRSQRRGLGPRSYRQNRSGWLVFGYAARGCSGAKEGLRYRAHRFQQGAYRKSERCLCATRANGDLNGAASVLDHIDKIDPDGSSSATLRGAVAARKRDYATALTAFNKALTENPNDAFARRERMAISTARPRSSIISTKSIRMARLRLRCAGL